MKLKWKISIAIAVILLLITIFGFTFFVGVYNQAIEHETSIKASWEQMQNVNATLVNKLRSHGFTAKNYSETFIKTIEENVKRYANDKNVMMKWITEASSQSLDAEVWTTIQMAIESGYSEFEASQSMKIDRARLYRKFLRKFPNNIILKYYDSVPSHEILDICEKIISSVESKKTFDKGEMDAVNPFSKE